MFTYFIYVFNFWWQIAIRNAVHYKLFSLIGFSMMSCLGCLMDRCHYRDYACWSFYKDSVDFFFCVEIFICMSLLGLFLDW